MHSKVELQFMSKFYTAESIEKYLVEKGCLKSLDLKFWYFLAIFLFYKNKHRKDKVLNTLIQYSLIP